MSKGSIDYAMPDFQDPFKGFREELGNIETKRKQSQEKAFKMAEMIEMADSATMFGNDYSIATKWAQNLTDNLSSMSSSTEGMVQFAQQANMLKSFIDGSEAYRTENIGSVKDGPQAGHWQGAVQRNISGVNPYGDQADTNSMSEYESRYKDLNESLDVAFDENGSPIIRKGGREMTLSQYQRPENPFMPSLAESLFSESGFNYYDGVQDAMKNAHVSAEAAKTWAESSLRSDRTKLRGIVNSHLKTKDTNMTLDEAMSGNNSAVVREALDVFLDGVGTAWNTRHGEDFEDIEDTLFTGGLTSPEGLEIEVPDSGVILGSDYKTNSEGASDLLGNLAAGVTSPLETVGFRALRQLSTPVGEEITGDLGENQRIIAVNVDRNGNIHASLETLSQVPVDPTDDLGVTGMKDVKSTSAEVYEVGSNMHRTLVSQLTEGVYKNMLEKSEANSSRQRSFRIQNAFDNATPYEGEIYGSIGSAEAKAKRKSETTPTSTEATSNPADLSSVAQRDTEGSANNQTSPFLSEQEVAQQDIMRTIDSTGKERFNNPELSTLVKDAMDAGYDKDVIVSVLQSEEWKENSPTIYRDTFLDRLKGFGQDVGGFLTGRGSEVVARNAQRGAESEGNRSKLFEAFEATANPTPPASGVDVEDAEPAEETSWPVTPYEEVMNRGPLNEEEKKRLVDVTSAIGDMEMLRPNWSGQQMIEYSRLLGEHNDLDIRKNLGPPNEEPVALEGAGVDPTVAENLREEAPETTAAVETTITQAANNGIDISESHEATEEQHLEEVASIVESQNSLLRFVGVNEAQLGDSLTQIYRGLLGNSSDATWDPINKSWCALFTANVMTVGGLPIEDLPKDGDKFVAKKYNTIGDRVYRRGKGEFDSSKLKYGDVVIMDSSIPDAASWQGHVAFYVGMTPDGKIQLFGGNQNDSINISQFDTELIYGIRRMSFDTADMEKATKELGLGDASASTD